MDFKPTDEEIAHLKARRELATETEKKRIAENRPFDIDDIKPGMSPADQAKALEAIQKTGWGGRSR